MAVADHDPASQSPGTTVLFTDMVGSTARAAALGDRAWAELLARHNAVIRDHVLRRDGRVMDTSGDGFFVVFGDPDASLACARAIVADLAALEVEIRAGLHTGDCLLVEDKCTGLAIHVGARLAALAGAGEILVSDAVRRGAGPTFSFVEKGVHELRGIPGSWPLFALVH